MPNILASLISLFLISCGLLETPIHTVTFEPNGGTPIAEQTVRHGQQAQPPSSPPARENYWFDGWYADPDLTSRYDFQTPVRHNMTLYARWNIPREARLLFLAATAAGETAIATIDETSNPPTITLALNRQHPFGTVIDRFTVERIKTSQGARADKQVNDILDIIPNSSITVTNRNDSASRTYKLQVQLRETPITALSYNGTDTLGQAIRDSLMAEDAIAITVAPLTPFTQFTYTLDQSTGQVNSDEYGIVTLTKGQIQNVQRNYKGSLSLSFRGEKRKIAPYYSNDIWDWRDLQAMRMNPTISYRLKKDIRLPDRGTEGLPSEGFVPVGTLSDVFPGVGLGGTGFHGSFDGEHHTISNFSIVNTPSKYIGLFGFVAPFNKGTDIIKNVIIRYSEIRGTNTQQDRVTMGVLAGYIQDGSVRSVAAISETGRPISAPNAVHTTIGGLIGEALNSRVSGYATGNIEAEPHTPMPIFVPGRGFVRYTESHQNVAGGLIGVLQNSRAKGYALGNVTGNGEGNASAYDSTQKGATKFSIRKSSGGLIGTIAGTTVNGYATGNITASHAVGGLVGTALQQSDITGYAEGNVTAVYTGTQNYFTPSRHGIGGLVGSAREQSIVQGYARGLVRRQSGTTLVSFGLIIGDTTGNAVSIQGYQSGKAGESQLMPSTFTNATGINSTILIISPTTTASNFAGLTFGPAPGEWTFTAGHWPAINLGNDPIFDGHRQPTAP